MSRILFMMGRFHFKGGGADIFSSEEDSRSKRANNFLLPLKKFYLWGITQKRRGGGSRLSYHN